MVKSYSFCAVGAIKHKRAKSDEEPVAVCCLWMLTNRLCKRRETEIARTILLSLNWKKRAHFRRNCQYSKQMGSAWNMIYVDLLHKRGTCQLASQVATSSLPPLRKGNTKMWTSSSDTVQIHVTNTWEVWPYRSGVIKMWDYCSSWRCHGIGMSQCLLQAFKGIDMSQHLHPSIPPPSYAALDAPITCVMRLPLYEWVDFNVEERKSCMFRKFQCSRWALPVRKRVLFKYQTVIVGRCSHVQKATRSQDLFWNKEIRGCLHQVDKDKF